MRVIFFEISNIENRMIHPKYPVHINGIRMPPRVSFRGIDITTVLVKN